MYILTYRGMFRYALLKIWKNVQVYSQKYGRMFRYAQLKI